MKSNGHSNNKQSLIASLFWRYSLSIFLFIALAASAIVVYMALEYRKDKERLTQLFLQRQNQTLSYEAQALAQQVANLFAHAIEDLKVISLLPAHPPTLKKFLKTRQARVTLYNPQKKTISTPSIPLYNFLSITSAHKKIHIMADTSPDE